MAKDVPDKQAEEDAAVAEGEGEDAEAPAKKKLPLLFIIIGAVVLVLLLGGGAGAYFLFLKPHPPAGAAAASAHHKAKKPAKKEEKKGDNKEGAQITDGPEGVVFYSPPDIVVNMESADGRPTFLKLKLTFELPDHDTADSLNENMPRLQDMFQTFLRELRPEDLSGSAGTYQLRMELLRRINLVVAPAQVNSVLIEEMLIN